MEQSPSWQANRSSTLRIFWNTKVHYRVHNSPNPEPEKSSPCPSKPTSRRSILILYQVFQLVSFPQYIVFGSMYETMSISTGLYPNLDLWNANKLHYITLLSFRSAFIYFRWRWCRSTVAAPSTNRESGGRCLTFFVRGVMGYKVTSKR